MMLKKILLAAVFVVGSFSSAFSQSTTMADILKPYLKEQWNFDEFVNKYDRFKNVTDMELHLLVSGDAPPFPGLMILTGMKFTGKVLPRDRKLVRFLLTGIEKTEKVHTSEPSLIFLSDSQRIPMKIENYSKDDKGKPSAVEIAVYTVQLGQLKQLALARKVEGQFGDIEFVLTKKQRSALKEFYTALIAKK
jgi:hypothetical protein